MNILMDRYYPLPTFYIFNIINLVQELILSGVASHTNKTSPLQEREYKPLHVQELILSGVASHTNKTSPLQEREYKPLHV